MKKKITVLQVVGTMNRGGAETMLMELFRNLKDDFFFIFLINKKKGALPVGDFDEEIINLGGKLIYIDAMWDVGIKKYINQFQKIVTQVGKVDIVHSHLNSKGGVIAKAARKSGVERVIVHSHAQLKFSGSLPQVLAKYSELYFQRYLINNYATDYWACSREALNSLFYKRKITNNRCEIINNAINVNKYLNINMEKLNLIKEELNIPNNGLIIGSIGRIAKVKQYEFIIEVLHNLKLQGFQFSFIFAGSKQDIQYSNKIFKKIHDYALEDQIIYLDSRDDLEYIYPLFDLFISASIREGLGMVAVEAQTCGIPCLLSDGYPKSVDLGLSLVQFKQGFEVEEWVNEIKSFEIKKIKDEDKIKEALSTNGFIIDEEAQKVKRLYKG